MANMKVGTRLGLGFGAVIVLMSIIAIFGINGMREMQTDIQDIVNDKFPKTVWANNMISGINNIARAMRNALLESDKDKIAKELDRIAEARKEIKDNLAKLEDKIKSVEGKATLAKVIEARSKYIDSQDAFLKLMKEGKQAEAKELLLKDIRPLQLAYIQSIDKLIDFQSELMA
ncbi:MAG: MCP four helix bundle domain-containing protein, partial [Nitrosomonadales bacterium]|nr:MCP four helix bundle domain-containing protein [Nitrosomonadales bacterium]